jgi:hypothetical protein
VGSKNAKTKKNSLKECDFLRPLVKLKKEYVEYYNTATDGCDENVEPDVKYYKSMAEAFLGIQYLLLKEKIIRGKEFLKLLPKQYQPKNMSDNHTKTKARDTSKKEGKSLAPRKKTPTPKKQVKSKRESSEEESEDELPSKSDHGAEEQFRTLCLGERESERDKDEESEEEPLEEDKEQQSEDGREESEESEQSEEDKEQSEEEMELDDLELENVEPEEYNEPEDEDSDSLNFLGRSDFENMEVEDSQQQNIESSQEGKSIYLPNTIKDIRLWNDIALPRFQNHRKFALEQIDEYKSLPRFTLGLILSHKEIFGNKEKYFYNVRVSNIFGELSLMLCDATFIKAIKGYREEGVPVLDDGKPVLDENKKQITKRKRFYMCVMTGVVDEGPSKKYQDEWLCDDDEKLTIPQLLTIFTYRVATGKEDYVPEKLAKMIGPFDISPETDEDKAHFEDIREKNRTKLYTNKEKIVKVINDLQYRVDNYDNLEKKLKTESKATYALQLEKAKQKYELESRYFQSGFRSEAFTCYERDHPKSIVPSTPCNPLEIKPATYSHISPNFLESIIDINLVDIFYNGQEDPFQQLDNPEIYNYIFRKAFRILGTQGSIGFRVLAFVRRRLYRILVDRNKLFYKEHDEREKKIRNIMKIPVLPKTLPQTEDKTKMKV